MKPTTNPTGSRKTRIYFIIGFVFLFVMAITWSLDDSFVYTSIGGATFFFFLAYYNRPVVANQFRQADANRRRPGNKNFSDLFDSLNKKQGSPRPHQSGANNIKFIVVFLFVGGFFFIILVSALFSAEPMEEGENNDLYNKAEEARGSGDYDSAEYYYRQMLDISPENLDALNGLGIIALDRQRYDQALNEFEKALIIDPDYEYARYNKALTLYYQKNYRRSLNESFALMDRSPEYYGAMALAGDNYYAQQKYDSAKYWYVKSYDNGMRSAWLCHALGYLYDKDAQTSKAVELYQEALSYDSTITEIYVRLGEIYPGPEGNIYRSQAKRLQQDGR
jgi:tetratricopeptide (TPR) repeat protein